MAKVTMASETSKRNHDLFKRALIWSTKMPLREDFFLKWDYKEDIKLVTSRDRVTNKDVVKALDAVMDLGKSGHYCIYSGVHGTPAGCLQIDDEKFYKADKKTRTGWKFYSL